MGKRSEWNPLNCPSWCTAGSEEYPCRGEHTAISVGSHIPASGGHFRRIEHSDGDPMPMVGVGPYWAQAWGEGQEVTLSIYPEGTSYLSLKPGEAIGLAAEIVIMLEAMVNASSIGINDAERVLELVSVSKALESALTSGAAA